MRRMLVIALTIASIWAPAQTREKLILDTDIGTDIDDAWALGFVAQYQPFETLAVTITDGNTPSRAKIACKLLAAAGRKDIPVAVGRRTAPATTDIDHQFSWAEDFTAYAPVATPAAEMIVSLARRYPRQITLLAVGPLQNVADALRLEPKLPSLLRRVVLMSGNVYGSAGNKPVIAEWNVVLAIRDAQAVYAAGFPLTIVPLDSTTHVQLSDKERGRVKQRNSPLGTALEQLYRLWLADPGWRMTLHDQLAVAEAAKPGEFFGKVDTLALHVDDKGFTRIDPKLGKPVQVCLEPKRDSFMAFYLDTLLR